MDWIPFETDYSGLSIVGSYKVDGEMLDVRAGDFGSKRMRLQGVPPETARKVLVREIVKAWSRKRYMRPDHPKGQPGEILQAA